MENIGDIKISCFEGINPVVKGEKTIEEVADFCRSSQDLLAEIVFLRGESNEKKQTQIKLNLPSFCFSAQFDRSRKEDNVKFVTGLICIDIDGFESEEMLACAWGELKDDPHTGLMFRSPRGNGIKVVVASLCFEKEAYKSTVNSVFEYYKRYSFYDNIDCKTNDISRLCFASHDADLYFNRTPERFGVVIDDQNRNSRLLKNSRSALNRGVSPAEVKDKTFTTLDDVERDRVLQNAEKYAGVKKGDGGVAGGMSIFGDNSERWNKKGDENQTEFVVRMLDKYVTMTYDCVLGELLLNGNPICESGDGGFWGCLYTDFGKKGITNRGAIKNAVFDSRRYVYYNVADDFNEAIKKISKETAETEMERIKAFCNFSDDDMQLFKHWINSTYLSLTKDHNNHHILLFVGDQGVGKTQFCKFLIPEMLKKYSAENVSAKDKRDLQKFGSKNLIVLVDEMSMGDEKRLVSGHLKMFFRVRM